MWRCVWVALMVVFTPLGARDGDSKWQAWVMSANKLILIDSGGIVTKVAVLPRDDRQKEIRETVFSHDGRYVLYTTANPRDYRIPKQVLIYDVWHNKVLVKENKLSAEQWIPDYLVVAFQIVTLVSMLFRRLQWHNPDQNRKLQ